jgi:hypothetical protein
MNTDNKNNRNLTQQQVDEGLRLQGMDIGSLHDYCDGLMGQLSSLSLDMLGQKLGPVK